jgi:hypothetical protein
MPHGRSARVQSLKAMRAEILGRIAAYEAQIAQASEVRALAGLQKQLSEEARAALSERSKISDFGRGEALSTPEQIATNGARTTAEPVDGMIEAAE